MMPRKHSVISPSPMEKRVCCFCGLKDDNEFNYGKFHENSGIVTHYYCLLFSSNMQQKGLDDEGILGFLPDDINKELRRGRKLSCCYCKKLGATLGCCNTKCKKIFHFPCGLKAGSLHQYFGEFRSYCIHHRPKQNIDGRVLEEVSQCATKMCYICYDEVNPHDILGTIWAPCCKKNAWFHRTCVQQLAMSAGYFFKCPLCNNKNEFQRAMLDHGIFIPSQDASWELVPNAFQELLYRHNRCDAGKCICPKGREHTSTNAKWELTLCRTCGSQGIHMACGNLKWGDPIWECSECTTILNKSGNGEISDLSNVSPYLSPNHLLCNIQSLLTDDESNSDSDISVGRDPEIPVEPTVSSSSTAESSSRAYRAEITFELRKSPDKEQASTPPDEPSLVPSSSREPDVTQVRKIPNNSLSIDVLPPLTKKPRFSESFIDRRIQTPAEDSDDDIIVVSGPSRDKTSRSPDNPWTFRNSVNASDLDKRTNVTEPAESKKTSSQDRPIPENDEKPSLDPTNTPRSSTMGITGSEIPKRAPIEIDLSDDAVSVQIVPPATSPKPSPVPELNIQITNVTSLAPEVFASVPEFVNDTINDSLNRFQCHTTDRPLEYPALDYKAPQAHEQLQIIRFDSTSDPGNPTNPVIYGLTIPGTNNTVPLFISTAENNKNVSGPALQTTWNNDPSRRTQPQSERPHPMPKLRLAGPKSHKAAIQAAAAAIQAAAAMANSPNRHTTTVVTPKVRTPKNQRPAVTIPTITDANNSLVLNNESSNGRTERSNDKSRFSYSTPLDAVVNDQALLSQPGDKCITSNALYATQNSLTKITDNVQSQHPPRRNAHRGIPIGSNEVSPSTVSQILVQTASSPMSLKIQNGLTEVGTLKNPQNSNISFGRVGNLVQNGYTNGSSIVACSNMKWPGNDNAGSNRLATGNVRGRTMTLEHDATTNVQIQKKTNVTRDKELSTFPTGQNAPFGNCDGDAGSGSAVHPTSAIETNTKFSGNEPTSSGPGKTATDNPPGSYNGAEVEYEARKRAKYNAQKYNTSNCSTTPDRNHAPDRTRLINSTISLRDLKFTVCGVNIVKMTLHNTYCVNINLNESRNKRTTAFFAPRNTSRKSNPDLCAGRTISNLFTRENDTSRNVNIDAEGLPDSLTNENAISAIDQNDDGDEVSNRFDNNLQSSSMETEINDLSRNEIRSRGQDELKENRDPVPSSTNITNNTTRSIERKSRSHSRSGVKKSTMQMLNELEAQETNGDEDDKSCSRKLANHDKSQTKNQANISYTGWNENECSVSRTWVDSTEEATNSRSADRRKGNVAKKSTTRGSFSARKSKPITSHRPKSSSKRPRYTKVETASSETKKDHFTSASHLVSNAKRTQSRKSPRVNISKTGGTNVIDPPKKRKRTSEMKDASDETAVCCKVSIDLARVRSVLANSLGRLSKTANNKLHKSTRASRFDNRNKRREVFYKRTFQSGIRKRSRSLCDLSVDDRSTVYRSSILKSRKWKSTENLDTLSSQTNHEHSFNGFCNISIGDNSRRGYKRKFRSYEKHDCVR